LASSEAPELKGLTDAVGASFSQQSRGSRLRVGSGYGRRQDVTFPWHIPISIIF